jgi:hypothetical protein
MMANDRQTDAREVGDAVRSIVLDVLRRRAAGESLPDAEVIEARSELATELRIELNRLQQICAAEIDGAGATATTNMGAASTPGMLQLRCPHCREPLETETDTRSPRSSVLPAADSFRSPGTTEKRVVPHP